MLRLVNYVHIGRCNVISGLMKTPSAPWWDHTRTATAARILVDLGEEYGVASMKMLAGSGLHRADLDDPETEIEAGQEMSIARNLLRILGDRPGLGVRAGSRYTLGSLGLWGFTMITSPTVRDLAKLGTRYAALSFAFIRPIYEEDETHGRVIYDAQEIPEDVRSFFVERELAKILALEQEIVGSRPGFHIETVFGDDRASALQRLAPRRTVLSGRANHALVFTRKLLDERTQQGDPVTTQRWQEQCAQLLERRQSRRGLAAQVRGKVLARLDDPPGMDEIASQLHMEERTLRRKLTMEGVSFRDLVDEVRSTLAIEMLGNGQLTVAEVAVRLGYNDGAAFSRAFKRWTGSSPGRHRNGSKGRKVT
ncbi:Transcriptional regulator, AraC family [Hoyosella subflava DQS3-9A1]|uniref:Transcriptional regulator, AraC family n=1 Tax=Hoyosella subflava (strain DSM 45089 / JCM 17490 / NBRC 109087 / DQS3-9A1) TaxID=443218 RepID=F6EQI6_HOYSD|nr:Transcriptional regulator, AraC family [Hoyosella subflava DQS3-9A1]